MCETVCACVCVCVCVFVYVCVCVVVTRPQEFLYHSGITIRQGLFKAQKVCAQRGENKNNTMAP